MPTTSLLDAPAMAYHMMHAGIACLALLVVVGGVVDVLLGVMVGAWKRWWRKAQ